MKNKRDVTTCTKWIQDNMQKSNRFNKVYSSKGLAQMVGVNAGRSIRSYDFMMAAKYIGYQTLQCDEDAWYMNIVFKPLRELRSDR